MHEAAPDALVGGAIASDVDARAGNERDLAVVAPLVLAISLGVLPLVTLGQLGLIVGVGVVVDTLLVRTVIAPALFALVGDRMWWPGATAPAVTPEPAVLRPGDSVG